MEPWDPALQQGPFPFSSSSPQPLAGLVLSTLVCLSSAPANQWGPRLQPLPERAWGRTPPPILIPSTETTAEPWGTVLLQQRPLPGQYGQRGGNDGQRGGQHRGPVQPGRRPLRGGRRTFHSSPPGEPQAGSAASAPARRIPGSQTAQLDPRW